MIKLPALKILSERVATVLSPLFGGWQGAGCDFPSMRACPCAIRALSNETSSGVDQANRLTSWSVCGNKADDPSPARGKGHAPYCRPPTHFEIKLSASNW